MPHIASVAHVVAPLVPDLLGPEPLAAEAGFYAAYGWCLNVRPRLGEVVDHLRVELAKVDQKGHAWQCAEVRTNAFLLTCAITDTVDDYLQGAHYDFSQVGAVVPLLGRGLRLAEALSTASRMARRARLRGLRRWRDAWKTTVDRFLREFEAADRSDQASGIGRQTSALAEAADGLLSALARSLPADLQQRRIRIPAAFRTQDLTHTDIFALAHILAEASPDQNRPIVTIGLRTAGSYFAPLIHASLANAGYKDTDWVTIRPTRVMPPDERAALASVARRGGLAVIVDEAPNTGSTLAKAVAMIRTAGFALDNVVLLVPVHPTRAEWASGHDVLPLAGVRILTLAPDDWRKHQWLEPQAIGERVGEYFHARGYSHATVVTSRASHAFNRHLRHLSDEKFHTRLKRVYEVQLRDRSGRPETRYVMAKSVGWGWLGYHAFVAADRLASFVPPLLGLRDGILYTEWLPSRRGPEESGRDQMIATLASYAAARVRHLALDSDPSHDVDRADQHKGFTLLATALSRAHGWKPATMLRRAGIRHELARIPCPHPVLIDGKMRPHEWIATGSEALKTDFEHHGLGKTELNVTDPAYDLAEAILHFGLSPVEERALLRHYVAQCDDRQVEARLFLHKLLAATWARSSAVDNLGDARLMHRHHEFHAQYLNAGNFLTVQTTRHCAGLTRRPQSVRWSSPLVVLDIDGVLDKQIFGFPSTTAAGVHAVSLLHSHGLAVAVNTARALSEVKDYCDAYGFAGGVAEYGGAVWDAVSGRERRLVSSGALDQLDRVRDALQRIPGVFFDDAFHACIRAYTFERGVTVPLPTILVRNLMAGLGADQLMFHQTFVDSTIIPREIDKGRGLVALLDLTGQSGADTIAIGDSEADLAMFRVAGRSFAPSHISCRSVARLLGCRITDAAFQPGFLRAVRAIVHPDGEECGNCRLGDPWTTTDRGLFVDLLTAADQPRWRLLLRAMLDPMALDTFAK